MAAPMPPRHRAGRLRRAGRDRPGRARWFWVDLLGFVVTRDDAGLLYLRGYDELTHHNLILREGPEPAAARLAFRVRTPADLDLAEAFYAALGSRTARVPAGATPGVGEAVRAEDPLGFTVEFFFAADHPSACSSAMTCGAAPKSPGWTTSTSWCPTSAPPTSTTGRSGSGCPRPSRTATRCTRPGCSASRPCTTSRSPAATGRACTTWASSPTSRTRCCGSATSSARCTRSPGSSAAPGGTACPTPSTSTCATRTGTGWRSTPATTTPATRTIPCCAGRCATRGAGTSGATP